jgi:hypothetical protein
VVRILRLATRCYVIQITTTCDGFVSGTRPILAEVPIQGELRHLVAKGMRRGAGLKVRLPLWFDGLFRYFDRSRLTREAIAKNGHRRLGMALQAYESIRLS